MQGSIRRPRIQVFWTDLADMPLTFPPTPDDVATIVGTTLDVGSASPGQVLSWDGSVFEWISAGGGSPGGADTQIQFNNAGAFGGIASITWDAGSTQLDVGANLRVYDSGALRAEPGGEHALFGGVLLGDPNNEWGSGPWGIKLNAGDMNFELNAPGQTITMGGVSSVANTLLVIDDANEYATLNKDFRITDAAKGLVLYDGTDYWRLTIDSTPELTATNLTSSSSVVIGPGSGSGLSAAEAAMWSMIL